MTAQEAFETLAREHVAPALLAVGFARTRSTFHRAVGPNWEVVNLQRSRSSDRARVRLTVNLGVGLDVLRGGLLDWPDGKRPAESACHFRTRIGTLLTGNDQWWDIRRRTNLARLGATLLDGITVHGFPWLALRSDVEGLRDAHLTDLPAVAWWELRPLLQIVEQLGPEAAVAPVAAEIRRRDAALPL